MMSQEKPTSSFAQTIRIILSWKMIVMILFGFSSGFPFYIVKEALKFWMLDADVDISTIGLFALVGMPYTLKFFWSPLMDGFVPPFLGRRRGWILMAQIGLFFAIILLGQFDPEKSLLWIAVAALCLSFFGASQDIALDAFRREYLTSKELGFGTGVWMNAWRIGMLVPVGLSVLADYNFAWSTIFLMLSGMMGVGIITTLFVPEPVKDLPPITMKQAVVEPFAEFFSRNQAIWILVFILMYKIGDNMASTMTIPFVIKMGFSKTDYFIIVKGVGMLGLFSGVLVGGAIMIRLGIAKALYIFGALQAISTACFASLNLLDHGTAFWASYSQTLLAGIVAFEFFATGMGQAAYATYMAIQTNKRFTATQYALLTSLMGVPGVFAASMTGFMYEFFGWNVFYCFCALIAIPGMLILLKIAPWGITNEALEEGR